MSEPVTPGFERPDFLVIMVPVVSVGWVECPRCPTARLTTRRDALEHWGAGHFDRRPLDTSHLPPARRILGRGARPRD